MSSSRLLVVMAALGLAGVACDKKAASQEDPMPQKPSAPGGATGRGEPTVDAAAAAAGPVPRERDVTSIHGPGARVRVRLPASWTETETSIVLENELRERVAGVQFDMICETACTADDIARFPTILDSTFDTKVRPNINTGDPELDKMRLALEVVEEGELPDGRFRSARITKPAGVKSLAPDRLYIVCVRGRVGEKAVAAQGWVPLDREQELAPIVVDACKTFEILR